MDIVDKTNLSISNGKFPNTDIYTIDCYPANGLSFDDGFDFKKVTTGQALIAMNREDLAEWIEVEINYYNNYKMYCNNSIIKEMFSKEMFIIISAERNVLVLQV